VFTLEEVRRTFDDWAPRYNATHASRLLKRHQARLALDVRPGDRVIEIACGTGLNFAHLRELAGDGGRIVGVDIAPAMLEIARREIARHGWKNVEALEADAAHLPFQDGSFDKALCAFALNIIPDYERAIAEVRRVLAPEGRFVALELSMSASSVPRWLLPLAERFMGICAVDLSHRTLDALHRAFQSVDVRRYLARAIFIAVADKNRPPP
jgi:demethylmenaquinone methyltransferase/2-methoxy-6-polyprenyl-1,4-benzoquinol methylase